MEEELDFDAADELVNPISKGSFNSYGIANEHSSLFVGAVVPYECFRHAFDIKGMKKALAAFVWFGNSKWQELKFPRVYTIKAKFKDVARDDKTAKAEILEIHKPEDFLDTDKLKIEYRMKHLNLEKNRALKALEVSRNGLNNQSKEVDRIAAEISRLSGV